MKRKILLKKLISMALIFGMYLSMSASAFASIDLDATEENDITNEETESTDILQIAGEVLDQTEEPQED